MTSSQLRRFHPTIIILVTAGFNRLKPSTSLQYHFGWWGGKSDGSPVTRLFGRTEPR